MISKTVDSVMFRLLTRVSIAICAPMRFTLARFPSAATQSPEAAPGTAKPTQLIG
jgi:hypothetical protein